MVNDTVYLFAPQIGRAKVDKIGKLGKANKLVSVKAKIESTYFNNDKICKRLNNQEKRQNKRLAKRNKVAV